MPYVRELQVKYCKRPVPKGILPEGVVVGPAEAASFFMRLIGEEPIERLYALYLNCRNEALAFRQIAQGTVDHCAAYPAEIARGALLSNGLSVVVAHNHPSGHAEPSPQDIRLSRQIKDALEHFEIALQDFMIVTDSERASFRELGLLPPPTRSKT